MKILDPITVKAEGEYGDPEGSIHIYDENKQEIVMWASDEWIEDPSVVFVIVSAINIGNTYGAGSLKSLYPKWN